MSSRQSIAIVIPTLCEAESLKTLLPALAKVLDDLSVRAEVIVVDDDSRDGTAGVVAAFARHDSRIRLLVRMGERGLSGAILHGWRHTKADLLGVMDADMQHPPELLPLLVGMMERGNDLAIASRYAKCGRPSGWNPVRRVISAGAVLTTRLLGVRSAWVSDPMSGFFLVRRTCLDRVRLQPAGFKLLLEILVRCEPAAVAEVPFIFGRRCAGRSKASLRVGWEFVRLVWRLYMQRARAPHRVLPQSMGD